MTFDMNEDGRWEYWLADNNQRVGFDIAYFDDDGDGYYNRWAYIPQAAPDTSLGSILGAIQNDTRVGGTPQRSGAFGLVVYLSNFTRTSVWAPPDSDNDGRPNGIDRYPYDPTR